MYSGVLVLATNTGYCILVSLSYSRSSTGMYGSLLPWSSQQYSLVPVHYTMVLARTQGFGCTAAAYSEVAFFSEVLAKYTGYTGSMKNTAVYEIPGTIVLCIPVI